ncbi:MAG TPA: phosphatase PAP2 family protein [Gemmatimonadaceae bacterium]
MTMIDDFKRKPQYPLAGVSAAAAMGFGALASRTRKPRTILGDLKLRSRLPRYGKQTKKAAIQFGYLGKEWAVLPAAGAIGAKLLSEDRKAGAAAVVAATLAAIGASHLFDVILDQRTPPPGRHAPASPHFPSGHALHSTAVLTIGAWVLSREGMIGKRAAGIGAGVLALALGFDRLIQDRHWTSDVVAGWLAAVSIAGLAASGYEISRPRRRTKS